MNGIKVGVGIIGTGFAQEVQIPAFLNCPDVEIVSVASGHLEHARGVAEKFGVGHFTADWRETASHAGVDLVCITTPPDLHREMTLFALESDKHVLCEKPMAMNVQEAAEMTGAAEKSRRITAIDHELRFLPGRQAAFRMLRDGAIGKIRNIKGVFQSAHRADPELGWHWWSDASRGGGALGAIGSHIIDSFNWLLGADIASVSAQLQTRHKFRTDAEGKPRQVTADDEANLLLRFYDNDIVSDATGLISLSMAEYPKRRNHIIIQGDSGAMLIRPRGQVSIARLESEGWEMVTDGDSPLLEGMRDTGFSRGFVQLAPRLIEAIRDEKPALENAASFADGLSVQRVLDAARESDRTGRRVEL